jgi:hypothetical protein
MIPKEQRDTIKVGRVRQVCLSIRNSLGKELKVGFLRNCWQVYGHIEYI